MLMDESVLALAYTNDSEMPPSTSDVPRASEEVVNMLKKWKDSGFVD